MGELFPVDLPLLLTEAIEADQRPPDGKLHASTDLVGSLRHVQLRAIGAPTVPRRIGSGFRNMTGTLWHKYAEGILASQGVQVETEVKLDEWMPEGWSGTADYIFYHPGYEAYVLGDLKTVKGESMFFVRRDGAKEEHIWQLSMYFHALVERGLPMLNAVGVVYIPFFDTRITSQSPEPLLAEVSPLPPEVVLERAHSRSKAVQAVFEGLSRGDKLEDLLAPEQDKVQKLIWDGTKSVFNVVCVPHWSAAFCDWEAPLCDCRNQGNTKIGHYDLEGVYFPRKGHAEVAPTVTPTEKELNVRAIG
jgi:hypothetical protein